MNTDIVDDYSNSFHRTRAHLKDRDGRSYTDFVRALRPDYGKVRRDIALGYAALVLGIAAMSAALNAGVTPFLVVPVAAIWIGYWIAYVQLFIHEGAHFNLAADRHSSDRICDLLVSWMVGTSVKKYRFVHFQHHRALGTVDDTEITYFLPLNLLFLLKSLFGLRALEVALQRRRYLENVERTKRQKAGVSSNGSDWVPILAGAAMHLGVMALCWWFAGLGAAASWFFGLVIVFPFFGALRQLLEHRSPNAEPSVDYTQQPHGAYTRMFGTDVFSSTFGGAGFNRHLLHHWEPQVSYTNLAALEGFLQQTELGAVLHRRRAGYLSTFMQLLSLR